MFISAIISCLLFGDAQTKVDIFRDVFLLFRRQIFYKILDLRGQSVCFCCPWGENTRSTKHVF